MNAYSKGELNAKSEIAMMGLVTSVTEEDDVIYMLDYISKVIDGEAQGIEIYEKATEFINKDETFIVGINCCRIYEDACICIIFKDKLNDTFKIDDTDGTLIYTYNMSCPYYSELGYGFYKRKGTSYHRIG